MLGCTRVRNSGSCIQRIGLAALLALVLVMQYRRASIHCDDGVYRNASDLRIVGAKQTGTQPPPDTATIRVLNMAPS